MKSAVIGWRTPDKIPAHLREISTTRQAICLHMGEGGRWLLAMFTTGTITYYDLDAPIITENILIPDQFDSENRSTTFGMTVATDQESFFLAFNLALSFCSWKAPVTNHKEHCIQIWKVILVLDEQQQGIGLQSVLLASFPQEPRIQKIYGLSLLGNHIAFTALCSNCHDSGQMFVVNWQTANGKSVNYPRPLICPVRGAVCCIHFFFIVRFADDFTKRKIFTFFRATGYFWWVGATQWCLII